MIHFDHYIIRLLTLEDLEAFFQLVQKNRPRLENFFTGTVSRTKTLDDTRTFVVDITQRATAKTYFPYLIVDTSNNQIAGFLDLKNIDWNIPKSELGCYIDADYEGQGLTTKAFCFFCDFCFQEYGFKKLFLRTHPSNLSARRVAEKAGFELEGTLRRDYKTTSGELVDLLYYGKLS
jgi:RimJ/RimL family protein N-acetyltransferase